MTMTNSSDIGLTCDVCGRTVLGVTYMNGMKFCAKCYQETFGNNTSQFVDMLNKEIYELKISSLEKENAQLKEEIEKLEEQIERNQRDYVSELAYYTSEASVKENEILHKAIELMSHELATYEWQGLGKFARSEEMIKAEFIQQVKEKLNGNTKNQKSND